jgi:hypothetical protein
MLAGEIAYAGEEILRCRREVGWEDELVVQDLLVHVAHVAVIERGLRVTRDVRKFKHNQ